MTLPDFPSNSRRPLETSSPTGIPAPGGANREPKLEKVEGIGNVVRRQKPLGRRLMDTFFRGNGSVLSYLVMDVLVPAAQSLVLDMVTQGLEKKFYGEVRSPRRTATPRGIISQPSARTSHFSYDRVNQNTIIRSPLINNGSMRRPLSQASSIDLGEIVLDTEFGAKMIVEKLYETIQEYGAVTVANLKELLGESAVTTDHKWGWTDGAEFQVRRMHGGFRLDYPEPEDLK
jgi:hypothetical protein